MEQSSPKGVGGKGSDDRRIRAASALQHGGLGRGCHELRKGSSPERQCQDDHVRKVVGVVDGLLAIVPARRDEDRLELRISHSG